MRYTVYRVTNTLNGKVYVGKHQTMDPNDGYLGSGRGIKAAIKAHGRQHFVKEVLFDFDTEAEMNAKEAEIVNEDFVSRSDTYNGGVGGEGGAMFKGRRHSDETKRKLAELGKQRQVSDETRKKLTEANLRRHAAGIKDETRRKISEKAKKRYELLRAGVVSQLVS